MATKPRAGQIKFESPNTGEHSLDEYLGNAERGGKTLDEMMDEVFEVDGSLTLNFQNITDAATTVITSKADFDSKYLGAWPSDPLVDNQGNDLVVAALYFNTSNTVMMIYNGVGWQEAAGVIRPDFAVVRQDAVATAGQTVFSLMTEYQTGFNLMMVYVNGVRLSTSDYVETDSNTVTFNAGLSLDDEVLFEHGAVSVGSSTTASLTSFVPTGSIAATNVQDALVEVDADITAALETMTTELATTLSDTNTSLDTALETVTTELAAGLASVADKQRLAQVYAAILSI